MDDEKLIEIISLQTQSIKHLINLVETLESRIHTIEKSIDLTSKGIYNEN